VNKRFKLAVLLLLTAGFFVSNYAKADDPSFLTFGVGNFDFNREKDEGAEFRLDYRSDYKLWHFKPFLTAAVVTNGMTFFGAGLLLDVYFGNRIVLTPSIAPTLWHGKTDDLDLGHVLEFRSQIDFAYRFDDRSRLGLAISHSSNASLSDTNPGTESLMVNYSIPFGKIPFEKFLSR
jgi:lipid A 3-O-deacylase